jgi:hypothetical protein
MISTFLSVPNSGVWARMRKALITGTDRAMAELAGDIIGRKSVDLTSHEEVNDFLIAEGIPLEVLF